MKSYLLLLVLIIFSVSVFGIWQPVTDYREFRYVAYNYSFPGSDDEPLIFTVSTDITKIADGYSITTHVTRSFPDEPLDMGMMAGGLYGFVAVFYMNPIYNMIFGYLDFDEMLPMKIMGLGTLKYEGEKQVGKFKGQKIVIYNEEKKPIISWVINPKIPLVIESTMHEESMTAVLLDYKMAEK
ncbi:hypothetical protein [Kosmotoga pacifica]|uniref:DUF3108 domain-containing protein n=1 Tax=Kosmotoga pacifica TaxID=1330330 RepID=A0A0G2Z723_9BACT|nr:hypothetical protein [Kosmotoga pacifica]AKI97362.1 hypothetical protein IX53_05490 [Kosmotoga pacifica]